jgi:hypothetical protein
MSFKPSAKPSSDTNIGLDVAQLPALLARYWHNMWLCRHPYGRLFGVVETSCQEMIDLASKEVSIGRSKARSERSHRHSSSLLGTAPLFRDRAPTHA